MLTKVAKHGLEQFEKLTKAMPSETKKAPNT